VEPIAFVQCKIADCVFTETGYLKLQILLHSGTASPMTPSGPFADLANPVQDPGPMTEHSLWRFSRALHRAINDHQRDDLEALIDDDVDWAIYGPIDMFPFLGARRGKEAVIDVNRQIADNIRVHRLDRESIMLGVDSAASMIRYSLTALDSNKPISLRVAHFAQFRAGRLFSIRVLVDTFDLVEQVLGHPIHLPRIAS
jgi:ketosteroid isomerase-like protein